MSAYKFNPQTGAMVKRKAATRSYHAASNSQFLQSWLTGDTNADSEIRPNLSRLRNLARSLERDNPYMKRFLYEWERGIIGPCGFTFQSRASDGPTPDKDARATIEAAFGEWKKSRNCTVTGDMPYSELKNLSERAVARDGNILIRIIRGYPNDFRFALQIVEADHLDCNYNRSLSDGSKIMMGKEVNAYGKATAYHILGEHPGESYTYNGKLRTRVEARDIIHRYYRERPEQTMGVPIITTAITGLRNIEKYEEAEVIASRISASSTVAISTEFQAGYDGGDAAQDEYDFDLEPGAVWNLPYGKNANLIDPTHPNSNYADFRKAALRGVASGLLMGYNTIGSDLEGVNYTSLREGKLNQAAIFNGFRQLNIDREEEPIFLAWLETVLTLDLIGLPLGKIAKFRQAAWYGHTMPWIDPLKDAAGKIKDLEMGNTSLRAVIAEKGRDIETVMRERAEDKALILKLGLPLPEYYRTAARIEEYGVGVRAGVITPNEDDEATMRSEAGLPPMSAAVKAAWAEDGGARKPITLASQTMQTAETDALTEEPAKKPKAPEPDEMEDEMEDE